MSLTGWKRWFVLVIGLLENLIFSGSILGWSALNYMLKQEGIFADLCTYESISPPPYRNYTIESTISGQLDRHPILNSYVNYSLLPNVDPVDDEDERIPGPESPALLSLPVPVSSSDVTTLPPADPLIISASNTNHRVCLCVCVSTSTTVMFTLSFLFRIVTKAAKHRIECWTWHTRWEPFSMVSQHSCGDFCSISGVSELFASSSSE